MDNYCPSTPWYYFSYLFIFDGFMTGRDFAGKGACLLGFNLLFLIWVHITYLFPVLENSLSSKLICSHFCTRFTLQLNNLKTKSRK
jgi:hypothetical protein